MEIKLTGGWRQGANVDTYTLQRAICAADNLSPTARHVGMVLALAMDKRTRRMRCIIPTLMERTGYKRRAVAYALAELVDAGAFVGQRTGRATIYTPGEWIESGRVDVHQGAHQKGTGVHIGDKPSEIFGNAEEGDKAWQGKAVDRPS